MGLGALLVAALIAMGQYLSRPSADVAPLPAKAGPGPADSGAAPRPSLALPTAPSLPEINPHAAGADKADPDKEIKFEEVLLGAGGLRRGLADPRSFELISARYMPNRSICYTYRGSDVSGAIVTYQQAITADRMRGNYGTECAGVGEDFTYVRDALRKP